MKEMIILSTIVCLLGCVVALVFAEESILVSFQKEGI